MSSPESERSLACAHDDLSAMRERGQEHAGASSAGEASERDLELTALYARLSELEHESEFYRQQHHAFVRSLSWRLTRPLRLLSSLLRRGSAPDRSIWVAGERSGRDYSQFGRSSEDLRILRQRAEDLATLRDDPLFDPGLYLPLEWTRTGAIVAFLEQWSTKDSRTKHNLGIPDPSAGQLHELPRTFH
jgi:hypothetical protein